MERDNYKIPRQYCVETLSGPVAKARTEFLGNNIYRDKKRTVDICLEKNTYVDCRGNVKFTLPLNDYKNIPR